MEIFITLIQQTINANYAYLLVKVVIMIKPINVFLVKLDFSSNLVNALINVVMDFILTIRLKNVKHVILFVLYAPVQHLLNVKNALLVKY